MKSIFIHIPKTAGRSICKAIGQPWSSVHSTLAQAAAVDPSVLTPEVLRFTCVRNPWDRVVSLWLFFGHMGRPDDVVPFNVWLRRRAERQKSSPAGFRVRPVLNQMSFCTDASGVVRIDEFLRFEKLAEGFSKLAPKLGVSPALPTLGVEEKSRTLREAKDESLKAIASDFHAAYTSQELIDAVAVLDPEVIAKFGYDFKDPSTARPKTKFAR